MSTRVYVPLTSAGLAELVAAGRIDGPVAAHAVTEALEEAWPDGDRDDWEYAALAAAAAQSWELRDDTDRPRRHVLAVEIAEAGVEPGERDEITAVVVVHDVVWKNIASLHMDTEDFSGDADDDQELAWFATQEIPTLWTRRL